MSERAAKVEVWKKVDRMYVVAIRGADCRSLVDEDGQKEESAFFTKKDAMTQAKRLAKHYRVPLDVDKTAGGRK